MSRDLYGLIVGALLLPGCAFNADGAASDSLQDDDLPMGGCASSGPACGDTAGDPGAPPGDPCDQTGQCARGGVCVAPFADGDIGVLVCQLGCVQTGDTAAWCSDDAACCSGVCGSRGECLQAAPAADSDTSADTTQGSSDGTTTGGPTDGTAGGATSTGGPGSSGSGSSGSTTGL